MPNPKNSKTVLTFDKKYWEEKIRQPDWYLEYVSFIQKANNAENRNDLIKNIRKYFDEALSSGKVAIASDGPDLDEQRLPIDTIVIHHTSGKPGYSLEHMNAVQLLNVYAPYYANPTIREERNLKGKPIWSGHFINNKQSFLCYHWLMRMDGRIERLLDDDKIGWHAGSWGINKRSIAICLDNDYEEQDPTNKVLRKLAKFIKRNYPAIKTENIIGHCEARNGTICPGSNFTSKWKAKLVENLN